MKATNLLERQHRKAESLFAKLERSREELQAPVVEELADALASHLAIEEQIFYPTVRKRLPPRGKDLVLDSYEEHAAARFALERVLATSPDDESFLAQLKSLHALIEDHVEEEEESLFPLVERHLTDAELKTLGDEMVVMNEECLARGHRTVLGATAPPHRYPRAHAAR